MAVKTELSRHDIVSVLADYDLGECQGFEGIAQGTVQTNYALETTRGKYVLRYYENRSEESVSFETAVMAYLRRRGFPCPTPYRNRHGRMLCMYKGKPPRRFRVRRGPARRGSRPGSARAASQAGGGVEPAHQALPTASSRTPMELRR